MLLLLSEHGDPSFLSSKAKFEKNLSGGSISVNDLKQKELALNSTEISQLK